MDFSETMCEFVWIVIFSCPLLKSEGNIGKSAIAVYSFHDNFKYISNNITFGVSQQFEDIILGDNEKVCKIYVAL